MKNNRNREYAFSETIASDEIKELRKRLNMTQKEFAALIRVSPKTVAKWEISKEPVSGPIVMLCRLLWERPETVDYYTVNKKEYPLRLKYYYKNILCTIIDVNLIRRIVKIRNYTSDTLHCAFGRNLNPSFEEYMDFLRSRCFPESRDKMKIELNQLDIPYYDPLLIIQKTEGKMADDSFRIEIERGL
ncbi:MAG: helix-turn-helix domain-containing protein [Erysipelotrichaceae bacterium]|nr:helix-turn-helix domain-containing protein [Erysipelotrichaceae bacterium]